MCSTNLEKYTLHPPDSICESEKYTLAPSSVRGGQKKW